MHSRHRPYHSATRLVCSDRRRNPGHPRSDGSRSRAADRRAGRHHRTTPVLLLPAALHVVAIVVWGTATSVSMFVAASVFLGAGRALSSGPLEAWFVDAILSSDAEADLKPGLARGGTAEGIALCLGTVVGGALPRLAPGLPALGQDTFISLSVPFGVAALMTLGYMAAVFRLVSESEGRKGRRPERSAPCERPSGPRWDRLEGPRSQPC